MSIFRRGRFLGARTQRYKIRITTEDGDTLFWHKHGRVHVVEEDVARIFVQSFKPELFEVRPDGSFSSPEAGTTRAVRKLEMVRA